MKKETSVATVVSFTLKAARLNARIPQSEIAKKIGMTNAGWGKVENGRTSLSLENMLLACKSLEISAVNLLKDSYIQVELLKQKGWIVHDNRINDDGLVRGTKLYNAMMDIPEFNNKVDVATVLSAQSSALKSNVVNQMGRVICHAVRGFDFGESAIQNHIP